MEKESDNTAGIAILMAILIIGGCVWMLNNRVQSVGMPPLPKLDTFEFQVRQKVINDMLEQYAIAKRRGTAIDAYVHAGLVAASYLQAHNEPEYRRWKQIEAEEGVRAGIFK